MYYKKIGLKNVLRWSLAIIKFDQTQIAFYKQQFLITVLCLTPVSGRKSGRKPIAFTTKIHTNLCGFLGLAVRLNYYIFVVKNGFVCKHFLQAILSVFLYISPLSEKILMKA